MIAFLHFVGSRSESQAEISEAFLALRTTTENAQFSFSVSDNFAQSEKSVGAVNRIPFCQDVDISVDSFSAILVSPVAENPLLPSINPKYPPIKRQRMIPRGR